MKRAFLAAGLITTVFLFSGCASTIRVTQLRYETPEVIGQGQHQATFSINPEQRVKVDIHGTGDFAKPNLTVEQPSDPPKFPDNVTLSNIPVDKFYYWARDTAAYLLSMSELASYAGVNDSLDIYIDTQYGSPLLRAKYQLLGDPASRARAGNFSLAVDGGYGMPYFDGLKGLDSSSYDLAIITGLRFTDHAMIYGGPFYTRYDIKDAHGSSSTTLTSEGSNIGLRFGFGKGRSLYIESSSSTVSSGASQLSGVYYGLSLEFRN